MKSIKIVFLLALVFQVSAIFAQEDKSKRKSPPAQVTQEVSDDLTITVDYSRPYLKGRDINNLAPVGEVWRTGANEASWIKFSRDVIIKGKKVPAGQYGLFTINNRNTWTVIINSVWDQWGAYNYDKSKDVARFNLDAIVTKNEMEQLTIEVSDEGLVSLHWADQKIQFIVE